ncbi:MAG: FixH family protein [bacterium]|nr:FixH family protein [bacterium]
MTEQTRRGRWWPWAVVALLVLMGTMMAVLIKVAVDDPTHVVEPDYYQKAMRWDDTAALRDASARLGWQVRLDFREVPGELLAGAGHPPPNTLVVAILTDSTGAALAGLNVHLRAFFSARADRVYEADLPEVAGGYGAAFRLGPPGIWDFELSARRDSTTFVWSGTRELGAVRE